MVRGVNKVILVGNIGRDPEVRYMPSGSAVANVTLATSEQWKDKQSGDQQERTEWHNVVFFGRLAEIAGEYLKKGMQVYVEGSLRTRKWQDKNGQDRYTTEIIANEMQMLGSRPGGSGNGHRAADTQDSGPAYRPSNEPAPAGDSGQWDDDIPFAQPACLDGLAFPYDGAWFGNGPTHPFGNR